MWTFQKGGKIQGQFGGFVYQKPNQILIKKSGTNYSVNVSDLSTNDQQFIDSLREKYKTAASENEARELSNLGLMEFTTKLFQNFPERINQKRGWMDATFYKLDPTAANIPHIQLGFLVDDKEGELFFHAMVDKYLNQNMSDKNPLAELVSDLRHGDKIRLIGKAVYHYDAQTASFYVQEVHILKLKHGD